MFPRRSQQCGRPHTFTTKNDPSTLLILQMPSSPVADLPPMTPVIPIGSMEPPAGAGAPSTDCIGYQFYAFIGPFIALQIIAVCLRFWARSLSIAKYDLGDYLIVAALLGQLVAGALGVVAVKVGGIGCHIGYVVQKDPGIVVNLNKILLAVSVWYAATESLAKLAVCLFYKQIFPQRSVHIVVNITIAILIATSVVGIITDLAICVPFSSHWGSSADHAVHCLDDRALSIWAPFPNIVTDVILLVIPIPIIRKLNTSVRVRATVIITFLFGSIGLITSIFRFVAFYNRDTMIDPTFHAVEPIIWTSCEPGVYLIAACLLVYRPLVEKLASCVTGRNKELSKSNSTPRGLIRFREGTSGQIDDRVNIGLHTIGGTPFRRLRDEDSPRILQTKNSDIMVKTDVDVTRQNRNGHGQIIAPDQHIDFNAV
ncbi:hypothetical protein F4678DRAFT_454627 [Xylaria arbuscula]|nr:hypothetical protein F4678DRAFT_454627 [Xylaria arbuscula]